MGEYRKLNRHSPPSMRTTTFFISWKWWIYESILVFSTIPCPHLTDKEYIVDGVHFFTSWRWIISIITCNRTQCAPPQHPTPVPPPPFSNEYHIQWNTFCHNYLQFLKYSQTCLKWPPEETLIYGYIRQMVAKYRFI